MTKKHKNKLKQMIKSMLINFALAILVKYYNSSLIPKIKNKNGKKNNIITLLQKWDGENKN